jgi:thiol-disulfide isomerase/thioredoxin
MCVYDGQLILKMNKQDMTIDSASAKTAKALEGNSYLFHSLAMLRNILPMVINNDSIQKSVSDTLIGTQHFYCIKMEGPNMYFGLFNGIERIGIPNLRRPYYLVIDKKTYLPYQFITRYVRGDDARDFITVTYTDINTKPATPAANSWTYAAYANKYQPFHPEEKRPMVKSGVVVDGFTLPNFTPGSIDSVSLHQFAGKVVLLDFWFKSCGPCMEAMPHYNTLQNKFGKDIFQLLTINIEDGVDDMKFFYNKYQPVYKMLFKGNTLFKSLGLSGCPSSVLLDKSGKVTQVFAGFDQQVIEKKIGEVIVQ